MVLTITLCSDRRSRLITEQNDRQRVGGEVSERGAGLLCGENTKENREGWTASYSPLSHSN